MSLRNHLDNYVSTKERDLTINDVCIEIGVDKVNMWSLDGRCRLAQRNYIILERAAIAAQVALDLLYEYYPESDLEWLTPVLTEVQTAIDFGVDNYQVLLAKPDLKTLEDHIKRLRTAVAHAGNIMNNGAPHVAPHAVLKPFLEIRDRCDNALKQPSF